MRKSDLLTDPVKHIDIKSFDSTPIIEGMKDMSFTARETASAAGILDKMIGDDECTIMLCIAGSTTGAGCMQIYADMVKHNMVDAVVAVGAAIVDMDFFEALGFHHYKGSRYADDETLVEQHVLRIYDTLIDEGELKACDNAIKDIADSLDPRPYSSREFIHEMGRYLVDNNAKKPSLVQAAYENDVPIFCPAFSDSSAGFGLVRHQVENKESHISIDSVKDFRELTEVRIQLPVSGLFMIGGGMPKNFAQDTDVCAEILGAPPVMHKYSVQITVADVRDGSCSGSPLKEAHTWGEATELYEQMVYAEATSVLPLIVSYAYHRRNWEGRNARRFANIFE